MDENPHFSSQSDLYTSLRESLLAKETHFLIEDSSLVPVCAEQLSREIERLTSLIQKQRESPIFFLDASDPVRAICGFLACLAEGKVFAPMAPGACTQLQDRITRDFKTLSETRSSSSEPYSLVLLTSGTSSESRKVVFLPQSVILKQLQVHASNQNLFPETSTQQRGNFRLSCLPLWHAFGLVLDVLLGLWTHQRLVFSTSRSLQDLRWALLNHGNKFSHIALVPRQIELLCRLLPQSAHFKNMIVHTGGAQLSDSVAKEAEKRFGSLVEGYGLTEAGPGVLLAGKILPHLQIQVPEKGGILQLKLENCAEFLDLTSGTKHEGWYSTGDWAEREGERIHILGREGLMIKDASGEWLSLDQFANQAAQSLSSLPPFALCARNGAVECLYGYPPQKQDRLRLEQLIRRKTNRSVDHKIRYTTTYGFEEAFWLACERSRAKSISDFLRTAC